MICDSTGLEPNVIMQGSMTKQGRYKKNWNRRYFILTTDHIIKYYKNNDLQRQLGQINLMRASDIQQHYMKERKHPFCFMVVCDTRTWYFECDTMTLMVDWYTVIKATMNNHLETILINFDQDIESLDNKSQGILPNQPDSISLNDIYNDKLTYERTEV